MEPIFDNYDKSGSTLTKIKCHLDDQMLVISAKDPKILTQLHQKLKRHISHKGFNDYFKPIRRLGKGAFATVYLVEHKFSEKRYAAKVFSR